MLAGQAQRNSVKRTSEVLSIQQTFPVFLFIYLFFSQGFLNYALWISLNFPLQQFSNFGYYVTIKLCFWDEILSFSYNLWAVSSCVQKAVSIVWETIALHLRIWKWLSNKSCCEEQTSLFSHGLKLWSLRGNFFKCRLFLWLLQHIFQSPAKAL